MLRHIGATGLCTVVIGHGLSACATTENRRRTAAARTAWIGISPGPIVAVRDRTLIIPVKPLTIDMRGPWLPPRPPRVRTVSGQDVASRMLLFEPIAVVTGPDRWMPAAQRWRARAWADVAQGGATSIMGGGFWAILLDPDRELESTRLVMEGINLPIHWIDPPAPRVDVARSPRLGASGAASERLGARLGVDAADPLRRWRVGLVTDRIRPSLLWPDGEPALPQDAVVEALARQVEDRWRAAIAALAEADAVLGATVLNTLTAIVSTPEGELLPAWPMSDAQTLQLQETLLSSVSTSRERIEAAREWLSRHRRAVAWVIDDAARDTIMPADDHPYFERVVRVAIAELTGRAAVTSLAPAGRAARNPTRLDGHRSAVLETTARLGDTETPGNVVARADGWTRAVEVLPGALGVRPPGRILGPLMAQWSRTAWLEQRPEIPGTQRLGIALLERGVDGDGWWVYIECNTTSTAGSDRVRVWLGRRGTGRVIEVGPGVESGPPVQRKADRWTARIAIPPEVIEHGRFLAIALERIDESGARWSWPRPMMPRQVEPSRAVLDLSHWVGLSGDDERSSEPDQSSADVSAGASESASSPGSDRSPV